MKKLIPIILILSLLLTLIPAAADAPTTVMEAYNCNEYVSLREKPDTGSKVLEKVYKGNLVYFCGEAAAGFYHVEFCGQDGYILSKYLKGTEYHESVVIEPNQQVYNCSEWVSLRKTASTKAERLDMVPLGATVTGCKASGTNWVKCSYDGKTGYISGKYIGEARGINARNFSGSESYININISALTAAGIACYCVDTPEGADLTGEDMGQVSNV